MHLKSITLKGFKSFPSRTRLEFGPGVSVIVGPNGSGKSNVTDAVLWALGEQSPAAVRGQSMQDVIFGGAPGRKGASSAEVELVLDDSDGLLGLGAPEISILRRLDRAGEGEYRVAGSRCRLVDLIELLSDTGLGKEMHSVISQGRVESIVTSKPRDRRLLIEEAAGLGKHRKRRRRAQLKLERTQANLDRALDVEREARAQLRPLKRQAEAAEIHARLERQSLEARWELSRDELRAELLALEEASSAATQARVRRETAREELEAVAARRQAAEEALARRSAEREELTRRRFVAESAAERIALRTEAVRAAASTIRDRLTRGMQLLDSLLGQMREELPDPGAGQQIADLERSLAALDREQEAELDDQLAGLRQQLSEATQLLEERTAADGEACRARAAAEQVLVGAEAELRGAERALESSRRASARVGGELAAANQFLRSQARVPSAASVLADTLEVDPGYELAVAAALDGRLRAAVVADLAAAATLLDHSGADGGRILIPGGAPKRRGGDRPARPSGEAEPLGKHVRGAADAVALARLLLDDTWVVESIERIPEGFEGIAVTRAGRVWSPVTRELRQAPAVGEERILAERNRRERLLRETEAAARAELAARAALDRAASAFEELQASRERAIAEHRSALIERDGAAEERRRLAALIERRRSDSDDGPRSAQKVRLQAELADRRGRREAIERERAARAGAIERLRDAVAKDETLLSAIERMIVALESTAAAIAGHHERFEAALRTDRRAGEELAVTLRWCAQQEAALQAQLHAAGDAVTETQVLVQQVRDRATAAEHELEGLANRLELPSEPATDDLGADARAALQARLERLSRRRQNLGPVNPLAREQYADAVEHVEELERQRGDLESALRELETLIRETDQQIREAFERTFEATARNFEQVVTRLFPGGSGRLRLVAERDGPARILGGVPPSADADEDVGDGDSAHPEGSEEQLGVEIEITPAGKEMKRLSLLSGGEKSMTALAFVFAVFLARPCPFYILDEVEAALDDLNIDRFLELLRVYSKEAQFIVVTHQKRTMEAADFLYGVSMGGDGVSKVISRRLTREQAA